MELKVDVSDSRQGTQRRFFARLGELGRPDQRVSSADRRAYGGWFLRRTGNRPATARPDRDRHCSGQPYDEHGIFFSPASAVGKDDSYTVDLAGNYGVPLGPAKPTQSQYSADGIGDLVKTYSRIGAGGNDQMVLLPDGTTPTYRQCKSTTNFSGQIVPTTGSAFCIIETTGYVVGAVVTAVSASVNDVTLTITVWKNST